jgi:predicted HAD superfamily Cof-like phosphohydrolase
MESKLTVEKTINMVREFHDAFGINSIEQPSVEMNRKIKQLRFDLMEEENQEYLEAALNDDLVEVADALGDMLYILCGTILAHGMQHKIEAVFTEIHRSNMSKLDADGKPVYREDGKVLKGPNYFKPEIVSILEK